MTIKQTEQPEAESEKKEQEQKPLLNITLPAPASGDPKAPLPVGQHNAAAQKNFKQVADIMLAIINNQKLMSLAITDLDKKVKELQKNSKKIAEDIRKFIEKEKKNEQNPSNKT